MALTQIRYVPFGKADAGVKYGAVSPVTKMILLKPLRDVAGNADNGTKE